MTQIVLLLNSTGWNAWFRGGDMPQEEWLPLPFTVRAPLAVVAEDIRRRFPGAAVFHAMYNGSNEHDNQLPRLYHRVGV